jgi:tRNA-specific 2-thiouridylase
MLIFTVSMPVARQKIFVAMSGGVDSSVAAALLHRDGHDVTGVFMKNWSDTPDPCTGDCGWVRERDDAVRVAATLGIPLLTFDFEDEYRRGVVDYLVREYAAGRTPNPDVMCNKLVKFDLFLKRALEHGADLIATGHYARIRVQGSGIGGQAQAKSVIPGLTRNPENSSGPTSVEGLRLLAGLDPGKDQSYFLHRLDQYQLAHSLFPVGGLMKSEVRRLAREFGLPTAEKKDSQGICFIGKVDLADFLRGRIVSRPGPIVTTDGHVVGRHAGLAPYTVGQRHGMSLGGGAPYFVVGKDVARNALIVSRDEADLLSPALVAEDQHWISGRAPEFPLRCQARLRYRQPLQDCTVTAHGDGLCVDFDAPQRAVAPGQFAVFYDSDECLGGAVISEAV